MTESENMLPRHLSPEVAAALKSVRFIAQHIKDADKDNEVGDRFHTFLVSRASRSARMKLFFFYILDEKYYHNYVLSVV